MAQGPQAPFLDLLLKSIFYPLLAEFAQTDQLITRKLLTLQSHKMTSV